MVRILHFLALLALMLAPVAMHGADAAPSAPHHAAATGHCPGGEQQPRQNESDRGSAADCALACSAMPGSGSAVAPALMPRSAYAALRTALLAGIVPGSDPPPPRLS